MYSLLCCWGPVASEDIAFLQGYSKACQFKNSASKMKTYFSVACISRRTVFFPTEGRWNTAQCKVHGNTLDLGTGDWQWWFNRFLMSPGVRENGRLVQVLLSWYKPNRSEHSVYIHQEKKGMNVFYSKLLWDDSTQMLQHWSKTSAIQSLREKDVWLSAVVQCEVTGLALSWGFPLVLCCDRLCDSCYGLWQNVPCPSSACHTSFTNSSRPLWLLNFEWC